MVYKKIFHALWYWGPPLFWMSFIFLLSNQQRVSVTQTYLYDFIIFKTLHVTEFAVLFFLLFRAFHKTNIPLSYQFLFSIVISILFATSDETHQLFIPTREGTIRDILIDTFGIIIMYSIVRKYIKLLKRIL